jgi:DegV family protein with EDD domain
MMAVSVLVDSGAAVDHEVARRWGIEVVPLRLNVGGRSYRDGEISLDRVLALPPEQVRTSGPVVGDFVAALRGCPGGAVVVTVSAGLSSTHQAAVLAARVSDVPVRVVDSETAAGAQALVALDAAGAATAGGDLDAVETAAKRAVPEVRLAGCVGSLDRLARSGRVPGIAAYAGQLLGAHPLFILERGRIRPLRPAFSRAAALDRILSMWRSARAPDTVAEAVLLHAGQPDGLDQLAAGVAAEQPKLMMTSMFGCVLAAHAGPDVLGLAWRWRLDRHPATRPADRGDN